ncbi:ABC transporter substrate-binding protein [Nocardioides guangzhouensis]|uniref:ABC transporter substrate-binding protein n=1 Tax=Nocardioides guangzhouensis TaxID=2497878 RepID=UPI001438363D|nr:extracellular solute-binding protein [Nocardioides guangzhouensis]
MRRAASFVCAVVLASMLAACTSDDEPTPDPVGTKDDPVKLSFMTYGPDEEVEAYESIVEDFNETHDGVEVKLHHVDNQDAALRALRAGVNPDVFLLARRDLAEIVRDQRNQPVDELLDSRGVDFGDYYKRDALQAFSLDDRLQCMPYGVSPMVIYYNTNLIDFETMKEQGLPAPGPESTSWNFEQFSAAADYATRRGTKGVYVAASLQGLAPFVYSGGGQVFDDPKEPTTLTLSDDSSREALGTTMELLRTDRLTLSPRQLRRKSALQRFKEGKLGMIAGYRDLVPELRKTPSLSFDVMPMPAIESSRTVGTTTGLCMSSEPSSVSAAADFIVDAISTESVSRVAEAGYLVPSNNEVAESDAFLQPDRLPAHPEVFNKSVRDIVISPPDVDLKRLEQVIHPGIYRLFYARILNIEAVTESIDEASRSVVGAGENSTDE